MHYLTLVLRSLRTRHDDDIIDRANYYYTGGLLIVFAILVSAKQYVGYPIQCWIPAHFTEAMEQYTENYCWVENTWWLPMDEHVPVEIYKRQDAQLVYYQWVPFILLLEAILFNIPNVLWRLMNWKTGIDAQSIVQMAFDARGMMELSNRQKTIEIVGLYLEDALIAHEEVKDTKPPVMYNYAGYSFSTRMVGCTVPTGVSVLYILLYYLLGIYDPFFGATMVYDLALDKKWPTTGHFPRVTWCDFEVKMLGNTHRNTIQCVLMINMFNEKVFLFVWFWFIVLFVATFVSLIYWSCEMCIGSRRRKFVMQNLRVIDRRLAYRQKDLTSKFIFDFLNYDGVFVLRLIASHAGASILSEVLNQLWKSFKERAPDMCNNLALTGSFRESVPPSYDVASESVHLIDEFDDIINSPAFSTFPRGDMPGRIRNDARTMSVDRYDLIRNMGFRPIQNRRNEAKAEKEERSHYFRKSHDKNNFSENAGNNRVGLSMVKSSGLSEKMDQTVGRKGFKREAFGDKIAGIRNFNRKNPKYESKIARQISRKGPGGFGDDDLFE